MRALHWLTIPAACAALAAPAAAQTDSFAVNDTMRSFIVHAPTGLTSPALVINMHGLGSNASQQQAYTRFDAVADREGFVTVYPNGINNSWDIIGNRDVTFILALIDTLVRRNGIDRNRVYATGFSMGGFMSHRLACAASDRIAAIGPVSGLNASSYNCTITRPVPVMQIHGTADTIVRYSGVAATITGWVTRNGCPTTAVVTDPYPASVPTSATSMSYYGPCNGGSEVVLLTVEGAEHVYPGGWGATGFGISAPEELWAFFNRHSLAVVGRPAAFRTQGDAPVVSLRGNALTIHSATGLRSARLLDARGRVMGEWDGDAGGEFSAEIAVPAGLASGVYLLRAHGHAGAWSALVSVP